MAQLGGVAFKGVKQKVEVDVMQVALRQGDVFFLCSDGLSNNVEEREILGAVQSADDWPEKLRRLVGNALENGGQDNITAMFAVYEEADG